ncbi:hypothetical protein ABIE56_002389 [Luteibacter sp. 621]|uniref:hypothetical protein n=1 Tax=Luteibacter sp. 621 TaxID=3373916 RepID=UPI003D1B4EA5
MRSDLAAEMAAAGRRDDAPRAAAGSLRRDPFESVVAYDGPSLDYRAVLADRQGLFPVPGKETLGEEVTRPLAIDGERRLQPSVGIAYPTCLLTDDEVGRLRKLRITGKVEVIAGRF